jgi:hypothetical protein
LFDLIQRKLGRPKNKIIRYPQHSKAALDKPGVSRPVVQHLLVALVRRAIKFDDEPCFRAAEVGDIRTERHLALELRPLRRLPRRASQRSASARVIMRRCSFAKTRCSLGVLY